MPNGSCLCGAVRFEVAGAFQHPPDACHCTQCRKQSGHYFVSANAPRAAFTLHGGDRVSWFASSEKVRRGFCSVCGSMLFWDPLDRDFIAVAMGSIDGPSGTRLAKHIFVGEKGDYYDLDDGLPQSAAY